MLLKLSGALRASGWLQAAKREEHKETGQMCEHGVWRCKICFPHKVTGRICPLQMGAVTGAEGRGAQKQLPAERPTVPVPLIDWAVSLLVPDPCCMRTAYCVSLQTGKPRE